MFCFMLSESPVSRFDNDNCAEHDQYVNGLMPVEKSADLRLDTNGSDTVCVTLTQ